MGLSIKEIGRLTERQFVDMYEDYKNTFDIELMLTLSRTTYAEIKRKQQRSEEFE